MNHPNLPRHLLLTFALLALFAAPVIAQVQPTLLVDVDHRKSISLDGDWHVIVDPYGNGRNEFAKARETAPGSNALVEYSFAKSPLLKVPGDWNTQRPDLYYYEGLLWYQRDFDFAPTPNQNVFFHIGAANYKSSLFVNGEHICDHEGGFTPFDCEVTKALHPGRNFAVIAVDNTRMADGIPTLKTDWWNYGGLTRDVSLVSVPTSFIDDYDLHLGHADRRTIEGYIHLRGAYTPNAPAGLEVRVSIPELHATQQAITDANGRAAISFTPEQLDLWSPEHPKLYTVELSSGSSSVAASDTLTDEIGFRTVEVQGTKILLNGKPIFLRGICVHAEAPFRTGRAYSQQDVTTLFDWVQQLGANFVRLAHYPHDERMTREADRRGVLVWSEVPVYWGIHFEDPAMLVKGEQQLGEMVRRDRNKASVVLWSIANETQISPARNAYLASLAAKTRELDPTRLVTAALLVRNDGDTKIVDDPIGKSLDVLGTNEYVGWYEKTPAEIAGTRWDIRYDKPVIMSEFGGGAKAGLHGKATERWTEEFQAELYRSQVAMLNTIPQLRGTSPWLLMDFRSPVRLLPGIQDGFNRKGLISPQGNKKLAFFVLQKAYKEKSLGKAE